MAWEGFMLSMMCLGVFGIESLIALFRILRPY